MGTEWFVVAQIKLSESAYAAWLSTDINFNFETTYINPTEASTDSIIGKISEYAKEKIKISVAEFFARELIWQKQNSPNSIFRFIYNKETKCLEFVMSIKTNSNEQVSKTLAAFFSIVEFKNTPSCDMCLVSSANFKNVRYISEIYQKNVIIMPKITNDYFIPENLLIFYKSASEETLQSTEKNAGIDPDIILNFKKIISQQLAPGIEAILETATKEKPSFITANSLYKTDGEHVLNKDGSLVEDADPHSFQSIGGYYAKDADNVFYGSNKVEDAYGDSFSALYWDYAKDKNNAYFQGQKICALEGGDFRALRPAYGYAASKDKVYYCGKPIENSDPKSFHAVGEGRQNESLYFGADNNGVYMDGKPYSHIDPRSFEHIGKHFFKDHKHVFANTEIIENCSPTSVKVLNKFYLADAKDAYFIYDGAIKPMNCADVKNLKVNGFAATDKIDVYYQGIKIEGADGATADIFDKNDDGYIVDKNSVFYCDTKIADNNKNFSSLGFGYATDGETVFFRDTRVFNADPDSFKPTSYGSASDDFAKYSFAKQITNSIKNNLKNIAGNYFKSENRIYYKNIVIPKADFESFAPITLENDKDILNILASEEEQHLEIINSDYASDIKHVYYMEKIIENADPQSFTLLVHPGNCRTTLENIEKNAYSKDANNVYYQGKIIVAVSPAEFKPHQILNVWATQNALFFNGKPINYIDFQTFVNIQYDFYKDTNAVYYETQIIDGVFPENLIVISPNYIKDEMFFCYVGRLNDGTVIKNLFEADENSFDLIEFNYTFSFDKFGLFFNGIRIEDIDINNLSYLGDNYLQDSTNIFCGNIMLKNIDKSSFTILGSGYASDGKASFYQSIRLATTKPIHVLGSGYATDGEKFWLYGNEIKNPENNAFIRKTLGII